jgi:hypothetical protein
MTAAQLANELGIKESYLKSQWTTIVERYAKRDIKLVRKGWGKTASFGIKDWEDEKIRWEAKE